MASPLEASQPHLWQVGEGAAQVFETSAQVPNLKPLADILQKQQVQKSKEQADKQKQIGAPELKDPLPPALRPVWDKLQKDYNKWATEHVYDTDFVSQNNVHKARLGQFLEESTAMRSTMDDIDSYVLKNPDKEFSGQVDYELLWNSDIDFDTDDPFESLDIANAWLRQYAQKEPPINYDPDISKNVSISFHTSKTDKIKGGKKVSRGSKVVDEAALRSSSARYITSGVQGRSKHAKKLIEDTLATIETESGSEQMSLIEKNQLAVDRATEYVFKKRMDEASTDWSKGETPIAGGDREQNIKLRDELIAKAQVGDKSALNVLFGASLPNGKKVIDVEFDSKEGIKLFYEGDIEDIPKEGDAFPSITIDVGEKTKGGYWALNNIFNTLPGEEKYSVEELKAISKEKKSVSISQLKKDYDFKNMNDQEIRNYYENQGYIVTN